MQRLDRIIEVNAADMYVTVECGATWKSLHEQLQEAGPAHAVFRADVGLSLPPSAARLSQGSIFLGSTQYGTTAETVLGLTAVLADGSLVTTGSAGARGRRRARSSAITAPT